MGLTKNDYEARRVATLNHIRLKWVNRADLSSSSEQDRAVLKEYIRPLVRRYTSAKSKLGGSMSEEKRLDNYTNWAFQINSQSRDEIRGNYQPGSSQNSSTDTETQTQNQKGPQDGLEPYDTNTSTAIQAINEDLSQQDLEQLKADPLQPVTRPLVFDFQPPDSPTFSMTQSASVANSSSAGLVDWDNIEVALDAAALGSDTTWLPMINLKPAASETCHWKDFEFKALLANFEEDTGKKLDMAVHEFVYDTFRFSRQGGYSIALKRFVALGDRRGETFHLRLEAKRKMGSTGDGQGAITPDSTIFVSRPRRVGDRSDDEESNTPLAKRRKSEWST